MTISLLDLRFFAYHGYHPEEQILGNEFFIDLTVHTGLQVRDDNLQTTVNYEQLYRIVRNRMRMPVQLIETLGQRILDDIAAEFQDVNKAEISIRKPLIFFGEGTTARVTLNFSR